MARSGVIALVVAASLAVSGCDLTGVEAAGDQAETDTLTAMRDDPVASLRTALERAKKVTSVSYVADATTGQKSQTRGVMSFGPPVRAEESVTFPEGARPHSGTLTYRTIGSEMYSEIPGEERAALGKKWSRTKFPVPDPSGELATHNRRPSQFLTTMLRSGAPSIVAEETVRGTRTMRFTRTIPLADVEGELPPGIAPSTGTMTLDLWVDSKFQLRKVDQEGLVVTFLDFDVPVNVEPPPASDVMDVPFMGR
jgi:hypothetical protein